MNEVVIILQSETYTLKVKKLFKQLRIPSKFVTITTKGVGCQRGIEVPSEAFFKAAKALRDNGIEYRIS